MRAPAKAFLVLSLALVALVAACSGSPARHAAAPDRNDAIVTLDCPVPEAEVWVDGRFAARVVDFRGGMALSPGSHRIIIRHESYHDHYVELEVGPRERRVLEVRLAEVLP